MGFIATAVGAVVILGLAWIGLRAVVRVVAHGTIAAILGLILPTPSK